MRLLHAKKLYFEEFFDNRIPKYAILSHRWEENEVSLQDFEEGKKKDGAGFSKILRCCSLARSEGYEWVWIDTCCIDKKSSADLSEAINSMFRWYMNANICYAYLSDVELDWVDGGQVAVGFEESKWFTRGWTLQELLAPMQVLFLDRYWNVIGFKNERFRFKKGINLSQSLSQITSIPVAFLQPSLSSSLETINGFSSVAQTMSWAAGRKTSRIEDVAYCLMGIFDVNMPLLYGEGDKAFIRLQQEIAKQSTDESLFAFNNNHVRRKLGHRCGLFAISPTCFSACGNVKRGRYISWIEHSTFTPTDAGIQMEVNLIRLSDNYWLLPLNCVTEKARLSLVSETKSRRHAVLLLEYEGKYFRTVHSEGLDVMDDPRIEQVLERYEEIKASEQLKHQDATVNLPPGVHASRRTYIKPSMAFVPRGMVFLDEPP